MRRFFKKLFSLLIFIAILALIWYFFHGWIERQFMKAKGMYYIHKGDQAYSQDNMSKTLEYYKKGLSLHPGHYEAWYNLGNIYAVYEDYYSAVDAYKNAIKYNPKFVMARMNLGIVYSEDLGFFDEAIEQFDTIPDIKLFNLWIPFVYSNVKSIKGNRGIAHYNKGVAYKQKAMFLPLEKKHQAYQFLGEAIDAYTDAAKILKKNYDVFYNRAVAHHLRGEYNKAGLDYCKAIEINPMKFEGHYNLAVLLRHTQHYRESMNELTKAAQLITESADDSGLQTAYIFNLLNEVSRKFMTSGEFGTTKLTDSPIGSSSFTYVNGRIVADDDFDKAMLKNLKTCAGKDTFKRAEDDEF
ncbi:tetratricopeptide repeat protein [bacterium]|nr:tetratricopeptide repeat protein [bacterium]